LIPEQIIDNGKKEKMKTGKKVKNNRGSALIGLVLAALMLGTLTLLFVTKVSSREVLSSGFARSSQARYYAQSGVEYSLLYAYNHPTFMQANNNLQLDTSDAALTMNYVKNTDTLTSAAVMTAGSAEQSTVRLTNFSRYVPPRNVTVYATLIGDSGSIWIDSSLARDSANGPNSTYATITSSNNGDIQTFAGFNTPSRSSPVTKVEAVVHYYLPTNLTKGNFDVRWGRQSDNKKGSYATVSYTELNSGVDANGIGTLVLDMGAATNIKGWNWSYFAPPTDFQIEIRTRSLVSAGRIYIDSVGYKISW
jgi:hypothetical protein